MSPYRALASSAQATANGSRAIMTALAPPRDVEAAMAGSPVFIIGGARSGSSVLYRALQLHPSFRPDPTYLIESKFFSHVPQTHRFRIGHPQSLWSFMASNERLYADFLAAIRPWRSLHRITAPIGRKLARREVAAWAYLNGHHLIAREYFARAWLARRCSRLVEKTPANVPHAAKLVAAFPAARLVYISRHPVETYASFRRRFAQDPDAHWADTSLNRFVARYRLETRLLQRHLARGLRLLLIRYEDLTHEPERTMQTVASFVGEAFDPVMLEEYEGASNPWDPQLGGAIQPTATEWVEYVDPAAARQIERALSSSLLWRGHALQVSGDT